MLFRIDDVSFISTINVDAPIEILSLAPTLVKILSTIPKVALVAGTKLQIWASNDIKAVCRRKADLPDMLGPVIIIIC